MSSLNITTTAEVTFKYFFQERENVEEGFLGFSISKQGVFGL